MAQYDWASPYCPRAIRLHIVRRTGEPDAEHPFLDQPWYATHPGGGIAWGVLACPSMRTLLGLLKRQRMEQEIGYPRYLIGATGHGASSLRRKPMEPLPLSDLIFLYDDFDIRAWLLANPGKDPLDLLVLEARQDQGQNRDKTTAPCSRCGTLFSTNESGIAGDTRMIRRKRRMTIMTKATKTAIAMTMRRKPYEMR